MHIVSWGDRGGNPGIREAVLERKKIGVRRLTLISVA